MISSSDRIGLLIPTLTVGGAEKVAVLINKGFSKKNYTKLFVQEDNIELDICESNIKVLTGKKDEGLFQKLITYPKYLYKMVRLLKKYKINILISFMDRSNVLNVLLSKFNKKYIPVLTIHTVPSESVIKKGKIKTILIECFYKSIRTNIKIISVSQGIKNELSLKGFNNVQVVGNPIDIPDIREKSTEMIEPELKLDKNSLIAVGRLTVEKGFNYLIEGFCKLSKTNKSLNLFIIGDGPERDSLERLINKKKMNNKIFLLGSKSNPYKYISRSKLLIVSSLYEGFGVVIIESMALSVPVISTKCKYGPKEILTGENFNGNGNGFEEFGILIDEIDKNNPSKFYKQLSEKTNILINNSNIYEYYADISIERSKEFNYTTIARKYAEALK